ncbi:MAG: glycosyltransferase [Actinomycetes bacterium]
MRVLHVIAGLASSDGGPARAVQECAAASALRGHRVRVLATDAGLGPGRHPESPGGAVSYELFPHVGDGPLRYSRGLNSAIRHHVARADVVHVHSLYMPHTLVSLSAAERAGVPCVVRPHGTLDSYQRRRHRVRKSLWDLVTRQHVRLGAAGVVLHAVSAVEASQIREAVPDAHVEVAELGVAGPEPQAPAERPTVLFLGRIAEKKRLDVLFGAMKRVVDVHAAPGPPPVLVLAGERPTDVARVDRMLEVAGVRAYVERVGVVDGARKAALLATAWCTALVSEDENFGVAVAESLVAGVPVVVSDEVAIADFVRANPAGGVVVPVGDERAAALALRALLDRPRGLEERRRLSADAVARFGLQGLGERLDVLYRAAGAAGP